MEIKVNIPQNDYVQPTEVRQEYVQAICNAFLEGKSYTSRGNGYKQQEIYVVYQDRFKYFETEKYVRQGIYYHGKEYYSQLFKFNGAEMKAAFNCLTKAGYHIFLETDGPVREYRCCKKPIDHMDCNAREVFEFNDFID